MSQKWNFQSSHGHKMKKQSIKNFNYMYIHFNKYEKLYLHKMQNSNMKDDTYMSTDQLIIEGI